LIRLLPFEREDCERLLSWVDDSPEFLVQWAGTRFTYPLTLDQLEAYWESAQGNETDRLIFKAVNECGEVVGHIELSLIDHVHRSAHVSRVLVAPAWRGKGIGRQLIREILRVGFEELHLHRIDLGVFDFNHSAIRCYEQAGFVREGLLRECRKVGDRYWNLVRMSILEQEYRERYGATG
jgi:RimJ/RimL family protein N-acetyltransferase